MKRPKRLTVPQFGIVKGGQLAGYHFQILRFIATPTTLRLLARVTPPAWPFPKDRELQFFDFMQLRRVKGSRAKSLDALALMRSAITLEGLQPPDWLDEVKTVRSALSRLDCRVRPMARALGEWTGGVVPMEVAA